MFFGLFKSKEEAKATESGTPLMPRTAHDFSGLDFASYLKMRKELNVFNLEESDAQPKNYGDASFDLQMDYLINTSNDPADQKPELIDLWARFYKEKIAYEEDFSSMLEHFSFDHRGKLIF